MKVEIWSDIACPWCYIGRRRFEKALGQFEYGDQVEVIWRSYQLDPNAPRVVFAFAPQGLVRSPDGGATWKLAVSADHLFKTVVFDPFAPGTVYLAVSYTIFKSTDDGRTFAPQFSLPNYNSPTALAADPWVLLTPAAVELYRAKQSAGDWKYLPPKA